MTAHHPIPNATDSPLPVGEGLGVSAIAKRQTEVTMFAAGVGKLEGLKTKILVKFQSKQIFIYDPAEYFHHTLLMDKR